MFETFKTLIRGRFPEPYLELLEAEGIEILEQDVKVTITYRRYRSPTRYASYRKTTIRGAIAISGRRLAIWGGPGRQIDVPFADPKFRKLQISTRPDGLHVAFDAGDLDERSSGSVEMRVRSADPERLAQALGAIR